MSDTLKPAASASDIPKAGWVDRYVPAALRPYLRLARVDRPIGTWLLLFPCWWGVALAAGPDLGTAAFYALFAVGALVMRGAGCTFNDIVDRELDARVARTADRPIASGQIGLMQAFAFLGLQLALGLAVLLAFNRFVIGLGIASLALIVTYPFMKRVTWWPQAFLGITFNWGVLMGWAAVHGGLGVAPLLMYAGGIAWTLGYDTIYAHQDKEDDALVGVHSTALLFAEGSRPWIGGFYALAVVLFALAGLIAGLGWPYYLLLALAAAQLAWQAMRVDFDDPADCLVKFKSNRLTGWLLLAGLLLAPA
ncbi:MAG: 4-hydroxybenzoate octaprenyltransferase [Kiloniellales bacterium]